MIERLSFSEDVKYNAIEASSHIARYMMVKPLCGGGRVLDVACGEGYGSYLMASKWGASHVTAVDVSEEAIASAKSNFTVANADFICMSASGLLERFVPGQFDLIVSLETIEHLPDPEAFLDNIKSLAHERTDIVISCPNDYWYYPDDDQKNPFHLRKYRLKEFVEMVSRYLGPPDSIFLGAPISGFCNFSLASDVGSCLANDGFKSIVLGYPINEVVRVENDEVVDDGNCSYFVAVWSRSGGEAGLEFNGALYPCSMNSSAPATRQEQVNNLVDEVASLRTKVWELNGDNSGLKETLRLRQNSLELSLAEQLVLRDSLGIAEAGLQSALEEGQESTKFWSDSIAALQAKNDLLVASKDVIQAQLHSTKEELEHALREQRRLGLRLHASVAEGEIINRALIAARAAAHDAYIARKAERESLESALQNAQEVQRTVCLQFHAAQAERALLQEGVQALRAENGILFLGNSRYVRLRNVIPASVRYFVARAIRSIRRRRAC